ncbi:MAG: PhzF family phenazine biosynthesis protein, partial [Nannocystaceae bacterium]|nr:PhzF family phenazine biosynthesis protein [Nannocystaceae bacterium]
TLQAIAAENNLSETAFVVTHAEQPHALRWFTPTAEVDLCGHATMAAAFVLRALGRAGDELRFATRRAGTLVVRAQGAQLEIDLPARPAVPLEPVPGLERALGATVLSTWRAHKCMAVLADEDAVRELRPDLGFVAALPYDGLVVTAAGRDVDFVSRYFAPHIGVPEDPVTGSAHCTLVPYWAAQTGMTELRARQLSQRGGALRCRLAGDRVLLAGGCMPYLVGEIEV